MIDIGICEEERRRLDCCAAELPDVAAAIAGAFDLPRQIGRSVDQEPAPKVFGVAANGDARLRLRCNFSAARSDAIGAGAIPLRQAAARRAAENTDANQPESSKPLIPFDQTAPA